jgi:phosphatidylglycerophosphate synthase
MGSSKKTTYTFQEVRDAYYRERRLAELDGELPAALLYRPLSLRLTPIVLRLGIRPLGVTLANGLLALALVPVSLKVANAPYLWVAALGFLFHVMDCLDGDMARTRGTANEFGGLIDGFVDQLYWINLLAAVGILVDRSGGLMAGWGLETGLVLALMVVLNRQTRDNFARSFAEPALDAIQEWPPAGLGNKLRVAFSGLENLYVWALALGGALGILGEVLVGVGLYVFGVFVVAMIMTFGKAVSMVRGDR